MFLAMVGVVAVCPLLPGPFDKDGWGLRVHRFSVGGPYLVGEAVDRVRFETLLINFSKEAREHDPLPAARDGGDLRLTIRQPDGKFLRHLGGDFLPRDPLTRPNKLRPGEHAAFDFRLADFGYEKVEKPGRYRLEAALTVGKTKVTSPPVEFRVVEVPPDAVLASHEIPLEGREAARPADERSRPLVQQVRFGGRTLLIYRRYYGAKWGGGLDATYRLAELPAKVETTVTGAYGDGKPLTIKYKDPGSKTGTTTLVINSVDGMPWTEEEQRMLEERQRPDGPPRAAPAPRPIKP